MASENTFTLLPSSFVSLPGATAQVGVVTTDLFALTRGTRKVRSESFGTISEGGPTTTGSSGSNFNSGFN